MYLCAQVYAGRAVARAAEAGLSHAITVIEGDATVVTDLTSATVVFIYLVPDGIAAMLPKSV